MFKSPAVWGELLLAWKFRAMERGLLWHCWPRARSRVYTVERDQSWCWTWPTQCVSSRSFQLSYWASTPSQGDSLNARSCKDAASTMSHNTTVSNSSGPSLRVWVRLQTSALPHWRSGSAMDPNRQLRYSSMVISQLVRIGRAVSGSPSGSIYRFI